MSTEQEPDLNSPTLSDSEKKQSDLPVKVVVEYVEPIEADEYNEETIMETDVIVPEDTPFSLCEGTSVDDEDNELKNIAENCTEGDRQEVVTPKHSRELKLLLALSKEANLDTNIAHKRKSEHFTKQDSVAKCRNSTGSQDDFKLTKNDNSNLHENNTSVLGISSKHVGVALNDNNDLKETKDKDGSSNKPKKIIGGAVDENGRRNRKLSNSTYITMNNERKDPFCWHCHHEDSTLFCKSCPRSFHQKCLKQNVSQPNHWMCPECATIMQAESLKQRSSAMQEMTLVHLCVLLKYALKRMLQVGDCEPFIHPVNEEDFPDYKTYIVHPMDLTCLERNIKKNVYGSPQAFESDAKWIVHNSIIFNSYQSKLTSVAKSILKICKQEMNEIENCATCYLNANTKKKTWFIEVCPKPHVLVWAKLKGFPYWPAKAMRTNQGGMVDVRFFGAHDRAWIHHKECFLFSLKDPNSNKQKKNDIIESVKELQAHVENLRKVYGEFQYAPYRVQFEPDQQMKHLQLMLPRYPNKVKAKKHVTKTKTNGSVDDDDIQDEDMNETLAMHKTKLLTSNCNQENENAIGNDCDSGGESRSPFNRTVRGGSVRMRGGFTNISGKLKVLPKLITSEYEKRKRCSSEEVQASSKLMRRNSDQSDISLHSNTSDKINKVDVAENLEIAIGNASKISELSPENDSSKSDTTPESNRTAAIQINFGLNEKSEILITPKKKSKICDRLMKKLSEPDTSIDSISTGIENKDKEMNKSPSGKDNTFLEPLKNKNLTVLEKVTELSADTNIFESTELSNDSKDFVQDVELMNDYNQLVCTEEIELDDKDNILLNYEKDLNEKSNPDTKENNTDKIDENNHVLTQSNSVNTENNVIEVDEDFESNKEPADTSTSTEESMDAGASENCDTGNDNQVEPLLEKEAAVEEFSIDSSRNKQGTEKTVENVSSNLHESSVNSSTVVENNKHIEKLLSSNVIELTSLQRNKVTIVNVEDIRKKNLDKPTTELVPLPNSILENRLSDRRQSIQSDKDISEGDASVVVVKSEPSSEDEPSDTEYLEKKRKYLSALNISEKMPKKTKPNEIRTRSKTEDKKFKIVDNISKVIDDVATHYSLNHANEEVTITRTSKKKEIFVKPLPSLQDLKPRARKSFPTIKNVYLPQKKDAVNIPKSVTTSIPNSKSPPSLITITSKSSEASSTNSVVVIAAPTGPANNISLLPSNQQITYATNITKPVLTMVQHPNGSTMGSLFLQPTPVSLASVFSTNLESQNYIPQSGSTSKAVNTTRTSIVTNTSNIVTTMSNIVPLPLVTSSTFSSEHSNQTNNVIEEVQAVTGSIPEPLSRSINDIICRTAPKLKPRPPGPLSMQFCEGVPSSAGTVTNKVNSISHRLGDYFRGMLIELLKEMGTSSNPAAEITKLKLENEELKHRHAEEILEIKKNISSVLKDMQKSLSDEKNRMIEETRTACELETVKRVEEAKSKQWCANCSKEAQFYCCWNTSYCDYPCQQKHWPSHMSKCTQQIQNTQLQCTPTSTVKTTTQQPIVLRQTSPPKGFKTAILGKSTKVLLNRPAMNKMPLNFARTPGSHITLVESTPGNYELVGNGGPISVGGKFITNLGKIKSGSVLSVTSTSNSNTNADTISAKKSIMSQVQHIPSSNRPTNATPEGKSDGM
ncbi:hypothetical protein FQR65_LT01245 [Abscondita terminalis]|nr:hypothetical protein FQR65_LT01245 [Abscondita terminalis]